MHTKNKQAKPAQSPRPGIRVYRKLEPFGPGTGARQAMFPDDAAIPIEPIDTGRHWTTRDYILRGTDDDPRPWETDR